MRKPAFSIFLWPLYSDIIFFIDHYYAGVSNKHCLLPFFIIELNLTVAMVTKKDVLINDNKKDIFK